MQTNIFDLEKGINFSTAKSFFLGFCIVALTILSGCSTLPPQSGAPSVNPTLYPEEVASALLTDESLVRDLEIQDQRFTRDLNKVFLAESTLLNKSAETLTIETRTFFKSNAGETLETSAWRKLVIAPKQKVVYAAPTLNSLVTRHLLEIRKSNP